MESEPTGCSNAETEDPGPDDDFDPDRLAACSYWRCGELFEARGANHRYCRKACRSRQNKWERAERRRMEREVSRRGR
ncbi:MAG: hypothetical protein OEU32_04770 [Acidimicrobiia bacterium]|nr:hypothetical protein [Acidimicrobiia bacterium]